MVMALEEVKPSGVVTKVDEGLYRLQEGDDPRSVAKTVYGDGHLYHILIKANPHEWEPGTVIRVPNKKGRVKVLEGSETPAEVVQVMFPGQPAHLYVERLLAWNGGTVELPHVVFVPER